MVLVFCDRCGRVITGMSAHERVSVTASGAAEKRKIFDALVRYKVRTGPGWTERVSKACGGDVSRETLRAIVVDGLMVDIHVWRVIERGLNDLGAMEKKA